MAEPTPPAWRLARDLGPPEVACIDALERLLGAGDAFQDITVEMVLREGSVSRSTFYSYFDSKVDLLIVLAARIYDELFEGIAPWRTADGEGTGELWATSVRNSRSTWTRHGPVLAAIVQTVHDEPRLRSVWLEGMDRATLAMAEEIRRERRRGVAPSGAPAEAVASTIVWTAERLLYLGDRGLGGDVLDLESAADLLLEFGTAAVHGPAVGA